MTSPDLDLAHPLAFLAGGGEMGARIRAKDWSETPLGPAESWSRSLKTCVRIILTSRQPMFVWWGEELTNLYNDAYRAIVGGKHPDALGQPASHVWREIWKEAGSRAERAIRHNEGTYDESLLLLMERYGYTEETYYTFSYSPVPDDDGAIGGILCANTDDTQRILGERQTRFLRELASRTANARTTAEAARLLEEALGTDPKDLPFALLYTTDPGARKLTLVARSGLDAGHPAAPEDAAVDADMPWPFAEVSSSHEARVVTDLRARFGELPASDWPTPPSQAIALPLSTPGSTEGAGVLVAGLNPYRLLDDGYRGFLDLVAGQVSATLANARAYEDERRRAEVLAALDRAKTTFFSNVSHEFRTPLTLMLGPLEDALASPSRALTADALETTHRNALRLLRLVNALLDFSRIEAGRPEASYEPTNIAATTADLASAFRSAIERAGLRFVVETDSSIPPVYLDRVMWEKIVLNLLSNALKFTFEGTITLSLRGSDEGVALRVADTGVGVPPDEVPHLFERFHRVYGARARTHEGSGIGLALVHELVRLHGGSVDVESALGRGTAFTVSIPFGSAHLPESALGAQRKRVVTGDGATPFVEEALRWLPGSDLPPAPRTTNRGVAYQGLAPLLEETSGRILLADDNADMRDYVRRLLEEHFTVESVADGEQALAAARATPPDLVLTDVMMPNLDGFGLLHELRTDPRTAHVPVIMLSARAGEESRVEGLVAGADDYLVKPFSARELLARVATHVQLARLRQAAEAERKRLYDLFMQAPSPVAVLIGDEMRFAVANTAYCEMVDRQNLVGKPLREAFAETDDEPLVSSLERVFRTGRGERVAEHRLPTVRDGMPHETFFTYATHPMRDVEGKVTGVMLVASETTEQVLAHRRVEKHRALAEAASRAKDEFLSTLSHELRTPLNSIVGWSGLLRANAVPPEQREKALEAIERNARVQVRLIEDLLDLSRIEAGKMVLSVGPVELVRVVEAAIDSVKPAADAKSIRLQPVLDSHATIVGDADRLQQVVWNLLSNAIKFTKRRGRVQIRLRREQSYVEIAVADDGQGIEPDFLPHVFDRFRQADASSTRKAGGLGLGLAIVRSLVELHGGTVEAKSDGVGLGATFVVRLPTAPLRADNPPPDTEIEREPNTPLGVSFECPPILAGKRVLVVDDEPETRELLRFVIEQCDSEVHTAANADEAITFLEAGVFNLLISDVGMPGEDGHALVRRVRKLPPDRNGRVPALALTAYARGEDRTRALKAGFNMHLAKPIEPSELLVVCATLVGGYDG